MTNKKFNKLFNTMKIAKCSMKVHQHKYQAKQKKRSQNKRKLIKNQKNLKWKF